MKALWVMFLLCVSIFSGCVGQDIQEKITTKMDGVVITDFSFDYSPIYAGESVGLTLEIQNIGEEYAILKEINVYGVKVGGPSSEEDTWGTGCNIGDECCIIDCGLNEEDCEGDDFCFRILLGEDEVLAPPNPEGEFPGDIWFYDWIPQAPKKIRSKTTYDFDVRVKYRYETAYEGTIRFVSEDYFKTLTPEERRVERVLENLAIACFFIKVPNIGIFNIKESI